MEVYLIIGGIILGVPFLFVFLILRVLDWHEKGRIFLDSWSVYLTWLISGFLMFLMGDRFRYGESVLKTTVFYLSMIVIQTVAIAAVLYCLSRPQPTNSFLAKKPEDSKTPQTRKIWKTAFLIGTLTSLMMFGLIMALEDIENKMRQKVTCCSFGVYD